MVICPMVSKVHVGIYSKYFVEALLVHSYVSHLWLVLLIWLLGIFNPPTHLAASMEHPTLLHGGLEDTCFV